MVQDHYALSRTEFFSGARGAVDVAIWLTDHLTSLSMLDIGRHYQVSKAEAAKAIDAVDQYRLNDTSLSQTLDSLIEQLELGLRLRSPRPSKVRQPKNAQDAAAELRRVDPRRLPRQADLAPNFRTTGTGPIDVAREAPTDATEELSDVYVDLREKALELQDHCPAQANATANLLQRLSKFVDFLPPDLMDLKPRRLWAQGSSLRALRDSDIRARSSSDPDVPPLPGLTADLLNDLVNQFNVFAADHPILAQLDARSVGPRDRADLLHEREAGAALVTGIRDNRAITTPQAAELLDEANDQSTAAVRGSERIHDEQRLAQTIETQRNFAIALLLKSLRELKPRLKSIEEGALSHIGAEGLSFAFTNAVRLFETQIATLLSRVNGGELAAYVIRLIRQVIG
ncbi:hypothetical protein ABOZ73_15725 [Caulobacter sp. 73W]|uniref:Uncharacterized protein n=1 Tax=Caulobacter sp. 73W TaxID=3161137 RepID=A0AB39KRG9_9CAUL